MAGVEVRKLKTRTSYLLIYRGPDGRQVRTTARTATSLTMARKMAQAAEEQAERERLGIEKRRPERRTGDELCDRWEKDVLPGYKNQAVPRSNLTKYLRPFLAGKRLDRLTPADITGWLVSLRGEGMRDSTRESLRMRLSGMLTFAVKQLKWLPESPMGDVEPVRVPQASPRFLTPLEVFQVLQAADEWFRPVVAVAVYCGLRKGELAGLKWEDVDLEEGIINVRHSYGGSTKSGRERAVGIPPELTPLLEDQRRRTRGFEHVFPAPGGGGRTSNWKVSEEFKALLAQAGIDKPLVFRNTRSTFGTSYRRVTGDIRAAQRALGHASVSTTERHYDGTDMDELRSNASKLSYGATHKRLTTTFETPSATEEKEANPPSSARINPESPGGVTARQYRVTCDIQAVKVRGLTSETRDSRQGRTPASGADSQVTHTEGEE